MRLKNIILNALRIIVTFTFIIYLFKKIEIKEAWTILKTANIFYVLLTFLLFLSFFLILTIRWRILLNTQELHFPLRFLFLSYIVSHFFNNIFPTTIGGDVIRVIDTGKKEGKAKSFAVVFADRMTGFVGLFIMVTLITLIFFPSNIFILLFSLGGFTLAFGILVIFSSQKLYGFFKKIFKKLTIMRIGEKLIRAHDYFLFFKNKKRYIALSILLSLLVQINISLMWYSLFASLGENTRFIYFLVVTPVVNTVSMLPVTIGGLGVRETTFVELMVRYGVLKETAFSTSILFLIFNTLFGIIGGIIFLFRKKKI